MARSESSEAELTPAAPDEAAAVEASLRDVLAAAERLLALDLDAYEPDAGFSPEWPELEVRS